MCRIWTLWCSAALGTLAGTGFLVEGVVGTGIILVSNLGLRPLSRWIDARANYYLPEHKEEHLGSEEVVTVLDTKTVTRWIAAGLKARRRGTARTDAQNGDEWIVEHRAFRAWVKDNVAEYAKHSRKADQMWLLETLTGVTA